jgi:hypothetical protein
MRIDHSKHHQDAGDSESLLSHDRDTSDADFRPRAKRRSSLLVISLLASHIFMALAGGWLAIQFLVDRDALCSKYTTHYCKTV